MSETVAVRRWIFGLDDGHMITGSDCGPNILTLVLRLRENPGKNLNQEMDLTGYRTRACCVRNQEVIPRPLLWSVSLWIHILIRSFFILIEI